jgi:anti-anti-sigma regulatory factor
MTGPRPISGPPVVDVVIRAEEMESQGARRLESHLRELILRGTRVIVVELPDGGSLDASFAGVLLRVQRSLSWRNGRLTVIAPEEARRTLDFMGLAESLELLDPTSLSARAGQPSPKG